MYSHIFNPVNNRSYSVNSELGKNILMNYLNKLGGANIQSKISISKYTVLGFIYLFLNTLNSKFNIEITDDAYNNIIRDIEEEILNQTAGGKKNYKYGHQGHYKSTRKERKFKSKMVKNTHGQQVRYSNAQLKKYLKSTVNKINKSTTKEKRAEFFIELTDYIENSEKYHRIYKQSDFVDINYNPMGEEKRSVSRGSKRSVSRVSRPTSMSKNVIRTLLIVLMISSGASAMDKQFKEANRDRFPNIDDFDDSFKKPIPERPTQDSEPDTSTEIVSQNQSNGWGIVDRFFDLWGESSQPQPPRKPPVLDRHDDLRKREAEVDRLTKKTEYEKALKKWDKEMKEWKAEKEEWRRKQLLNIKKLHGNLFGDQLKHEWFKSLVERADARIAILKEAKDAAIQENQEENAKEIEDLKIKLKDEREALKRQFDVNIEEKKINLKERKEQSKDKPELEDKAQQRQNAEKAEEQGKNDELKAALRDQDNVIGVMNEIVHKEAEIADEAQQQMNHDNQQANSTKVDIEHTDALIKENLEENRDNNLEILDNELEILDRTEKERVERMEIREIEHKEKMEDLKRENAELRALLNAQGNVVGEARDKM